MKTTLHLFLFLFILGPSMVSGQIYNASFEKIFVGGIPSGTKAVRISPVEDNGIPFRALSGREIHDLDESKTERHILLSRATEICWYLGLDKAQDYNISYRGSVSRGPYGRFNYVVFRWLLVSESGSITTSQFAPHVKTNLFRYRFYRPAQFDSILCQAPETHRPAIQTLLETSPNKIPSHYDWEDLKAFSHLIEDEDKYYRQLQSILKVSCEREKKKKRRHGDSNKREGLTKELNSLCVEVTP